MARSATWLVSCILIAGGGREEAFPSSQSEAAMSEDVRRMHERLVASREGDGSISELRIELMDGSMVSHRSVQIHGGKLVEKEWTAPGSPMKRREGAVTDARLSRLLERLIAARYWTFQGTRFVPDAPTFLFRFYYEDLRPVDFRCEDEELSASPARAAIRELFLQFVAETETKAVPETRAIPK